MLALAKLIDEIVYYGIYLTKYRLDYRAIKIEFNLIILKRIAGLRLLFKNIL